MTDILRIQSLTKSYPSPEKKLTVLKDLNFNLEKNKSMFLFGPSGCGKSTFLNMIIGLDNPDQGDIFVNNKLLIENKNNLLKDYIGIVFQDHYLINELNVTENLLIKSNDEDHLNFLLKNLEINDLKNNYPNQLSNGQKQRVCVARSLINKPKIIIADEPTSYLDRKNSDKVIDILIKYTKSFETSLIVSSHDISYKGLFDLSYTIENMNLKKC
ncbi:MAG: ABC transporter ATP-binding protein [Pelagibacteraceae bacterium]|nr:ABC transporter ATP-binding protein [Pelagibacteraceae bacterium]|tara:strand:- start:2214 stop:2855 length:642 start_codon:yes stop_codon:yes gene_type:complete